VILKVTTSPARITRPATTTMTPAQIAALVKRLAAASHAYHNGLPLLMTDEEFDAGVDTLRSAAPEHPFLQQVGAPVAAGDEVDLPIPLPSLNKIKPDGTLEKWITKYPAPSYHVSVKLDGVSALWIPSEGALYTRGDGMRGRDISGFTKYFQGLVVPAKVEEATAVRGELIMPTSSPAIPEGKLARNIVAGALNRKIHEVDPKLLREIRFVAYEVIQPDHYTPEEAFQQLRRIGFETARATKIKRAEMSPETLSAVFSAAEEKSPYQLDGIVVAPNLARPHAVTMVRKGKAVNPDDRVAWKTRQTAATARTTVREVEWNVSASGMMIPRVLFDPVQLSGAKISAATGLHGRWIFENAIGPGAVIEVRRAGDVIPQIIAVHSPAPGGPSMPAGFRWDGSPDSAVHIRPALGAALTEEERIQLTRGLGELGAENVGPGVVAKLYEAGFDTIGKIYSATAADFATSVDGVKEKGAQRIWEGLRANQENWTELTFLVASCTMPRGVGHTKLKPLLEIEPDPHKWSLARFAGQRIAGLSEKTIEDITDAIPDYLAWRAENFGSTSVKIPKKLPGCNAAKPPCAMTVVFTGFRDKELETALEAAGHTVAGAVSKKTTHVVYPDGPAPTSTKITKAEEIGAKIMPLSEFQALL
jgi:NAD-dependent DNA ligase